MTFDCADPATIFFGENAGQIVIDKAVTIEGSNVGGENIVLDREEGATPTNYFHVVSTGALKLQDMTLQNGGGGSLVESTIDGGAIQVTDGSLTVERVSFVNNRAFNGGAIAIDGAEVTISQSRFERNESFRSGGAIDNGGVVDSDGGTLQISQSTFDRNKSRSGGAILSAGGSLTVVASTLTGNQGSVFGSTLNLPTDSGTAEIFWSTIVQSGSNDAIRIGNGRTVTVTGVIFGGTGRHCTGPQLVDTYSLSNDESCGLDGEGSSQGIDLGLGPLMSTTVAGVVQSYYPLLNGSPAINGGGPDGCDTDELAGFDPDQLGRPRAVGSACDIGAFESDAPPIIDAVAPTSGLEGQEITFILAASQVTSPITWQVDCTSDGEWEQGHGCTYPDNGPYEATFMVTDDLEVGLRTFTISIANVNPVLDEFAVHPRPALTGGLVSLSATASDIEADPLSYSYDCGDGELVGDDRCRFERGGTYLVSVTVDDGDQGSTSRSLMLEVFDPVSMCVNRWNGAIRIAGECSRSEQLVSLPLQGFGPLGLCVNDWSGAARISDDCSRSEHPVLANGQDTVSVCVNRWNGVLRVSDRCSRSERQDWI